MVVDGPWWSCSSLTMSRNGPERVRVRGPFLIKIAAPSPIMRTNSLECWRHHTDRMVLGAAARVGSR